MRQLKIHALLLHAAANGPGKLNCSHGTERKKHSQTKGNVYQAELGDPDHKKCTEYLYGRLLVSMTVFA